MAKVLIADDDFISLEVLQTMVAREGIEVTTAKTGDEALEKALSQNFDLVLLDYEMPGLTGAQVAAKLQDANYTAPLVAVTGHQSATELSACRDAGMVATIHKPIAPDALEELLKRWL
ncbi:Response regulator receiver domain-containing protein [Pseudidiomarina planktonica]|uniref:Response regulator receiver domain-containing protein n=1 Tax=Pseudidiomarina planktonica TaxID=1323738 RepID=A0A1Y6F316_9GAMM|nr:response regulator [Pseudidiomarina planktonica]RUO65040.1 response regulator [Pseudidiomarina planktonica]SMQ67700.1 Response regulator receiver domain-containing protein [Pseudidiomarina planktonica]